MTAALGAGSTTTHLQFIQQLVEIAGRHIFSTASTLLLQSAGSNLLPDASHGNTSRTDPWNAHETPRPADHVVTKIAVLQLLKVLTDSGVLLDVVDDVGGRDCAASAATAQQLLSGVKSCLLQQDVTLQLAAVQLACCSCSNAHARYMDKLFKTVYSSLLVWVIIMAYPVAWLG